MLLKALTWCYSGFMLVFCPSRSIFGDTTPEHPITQHDFSGHGNLASFEVYNPVKNVKFICAVREPEATQKQHGWIDVKLFWLKPERGAPWRGQVLLLVHVNGCGSTRVTEISTRAKSPNSYPSHLPVLNAASKPPHGELCVRNRSPSVLFFLSFQCTQWRKTSPGV